MDENAFLLTNNSDLVSVLKTWIWWILVFFLINSSQVISFLFSFLKSAFFKTDFWKITPSRPIRLPFFASLASHWLWGTPPSAGSRSAAVTLKCQLKAFRCKVQLSCCAGPAGCGGRRRAPGGAGPGRPAGLLGYRPPTERPGWVGVIYGAIDPSQDKKSPCCPARPAAAEKSAQSHCSKYYCTTTLLLLYTI